MIYKAIKGSKIPIVIQVDGLGTDMKLTDTGVGLEVTFYCVFPMETIGETVKTVTYTKSDTESVIHPSDLEDNQYVILVETDKLDCGTLSCGSKVTYTDSVLGKQVIEIAPATCNVRIIEPYTTTSTQTE